MQIISASRPLLPCPTRKWCWEYPRLKKKSLKVLFVSAVSWESLITSLLDSAGDTALIPTKEFIWIKLFLWSTDLLASMPGISSTKEYFISHAIMPTSLYLRSSRNTGVIRVRFWMKFLTALLSWMKLLRGPYGLSWIWRGLCWSPLIYPNTCRQKPYVSHATSRIGLEVTRNMTSLQALTEAKK